MERMDQVFIEGCFRTAHGHEELERIDPVTERSLGVLQLADEEDADAAVAAASRARAAFARTSVEERIALLNALAEAIRARADTLTEATITEYGAPVEQARWRAGLAAGNFIEAARLLKDFAFTRQVRGAEVVAQPVGVAVHIVPWNSVYNAISVKMAGALAAGCPVVVKGSEYSALQNNLFAQCVHEAGVPPGVVNIVTGRGEVVGEALTGDTRVRKISFTGSNAVGKAIHRKASDRLTRVTLELGGKAPTLVMADAAIDKAAETALAIGMTNNGQACIAGTRILVPRAMLHAFSTAIVAAAERMVLGDPRDPATTLGPLVNERQYNRVLGYIRKGLADGARCLTGGEARPDGLPQGYFVRPTIFAEVTNDMVIAREEIFGPVLCIIAYRDEDEGIAIANDTPFGLHAYLIGEDIKRARRLAGRIDAGRVALNGLVHEPLAPFGGFKESGLGREYGVYGIEDHLELKAIAGP